MSPSEPVLSGAHGGVCEREGGEDSPAARRGGDRRLRTTRAPRGAGDVFSRGRGPRTGNPAKGGAAAAAGAREKSGAEARARTETAAGLQG